MEADLIEGGIGNLGSVESGDGSVDLVKRGIQEMFWFWFPTVVLKLRFWFV